jgi:hypothetical protein
MSRLWMPILACAFVLTLVSAGTADAKDDKTEQIIAILTEQEVQPPKGYVNDIPLFEMLSHLSKQHSLTFVINEECFNEVGQPNAKEVKPRLSTTELRGLHLHQFLRVMLDSMGATYLIRNNSVEIVPAQYAANLTKAALKPVEGESVCRHLTQPLVSYIVKEKPLNETVTKIAEMYDLTVVVSPQAGDARMGFVSARLLNMPAEKALELLALQADLRVVRRGAAFLITSKDHANEIFGEELEKERQKIELQKFRETPVKPPAKQPVPPEQPKP